MSLFGSGKREGILSVLVLVGLAIVQHAPGLFGLGYRGPMSPATSTFGPQSASNPQLEGATNQVLLAPALCQAGMVARGGEVPLWNPNNRFGEPFSVSGAPWMYPPYWLLLLSAGPWMLELVLFLHAGLACWFMYRFLRALPLSRYVGFLGAGMYGLGWFMTVALDRLPEAAAAAWLPLVLSALWRCLFSRERMRYAHVLGVAIAMMFLSGGTTTAWLGLGLGVVVFVSTLRAIDIVDLVPAAKSVGLGGAVAILLSSPAWLDWFETGPALQPPDEVAVSHLQPEGLCGVLAPGLFADMRGHAPGAMLEANPGADPLELALYPGGLILFVGLLGLFRPKHTHLELFWIIALGVSILMSIDGFFADCITGLSGWYPQRSGATLVLVHFAMIVVASLAFENFFDAPRARRHATPIGAGLALGGGLALPLFGLLWTAPAHALVGWLTGNGVDVELEEAVRHFVDQATIPAITVASIAVTFLFWHRLGILRFKQIVAVFALSEVCLLALTSVPRTDPAETLAIAVTDRIPETSGRVLSVGRTPMPPTNWLASAGVRVVDTDANTILARTASYLSMIDPTLVQTGRRSRLTELSPASKLQHPLLEVASVEIALSTDQTAIAESFEPLTSAPAAEGDAMLVVSAALDPRPRARLMFRHSAVRDATDARVALRSQLAHLHERVIVERAPDDFTCQRPSREPELEWLLDGANRQRIRVDLGDGRGFLFVADAYAPGWTATVDGAPAPILPANLAFRAVPLDEGEHVVEFRYDPLAWTLGGILVWSGLLLMAGVWVLGRRRERRRRA